MVQFIIERNPSIFPPIDEHKNISLGMDLVEFISTKLNLFKISNTYNAEKDTLNKVIIPDIEFNEYLANLFNREHENLPMISPPKKWEVETLSSLNINIGTDMYTNANTEVEVYSKKVTIEDSNSIEVSKEGTKGNTKGKTKGGRKKSRNKDKGTEVKVKSESTKVKVGEYRVESAELKVEKGLRTLETSPPKITQYGGYLLNEEKPFYRKNLVNQGNIIFNNNYVIKTINKLSTTKLSINTKVLNYVLNIINNGNFPKIDELIYLKPHPLTKESYKFKMKNMKSELLEVERHNNQYYTDKSTLNVALLLSI
jgi:hypothetical protein